METSGYQLPLLPEVPMWVRVELPGTMKIAGHFEEDDDGESEETFSGLRVALYQRPNYIEITQGGFKSNWLRLYYPGEHKPLGGPIYFQARILLSDASQSVAPEQRGILHFPTDLVNGRVSEGHPHVTGVACADGRTFGTLTEAINAQTGGRLSLIGVDERRGVKCVFICDQDGNDPSLELYFDPVTFARYAWSSWLDSTDRSVSRYEDEIAKAQVNLAQAQETRQKIHAYARENGIARQ